MTSIGKSTSQAGTSLGNDEADCKSEIFPDTHFRRRSDEDPVIILSFLKDGESPKEVKGICVCIHVCVYMYININLIFKGNQRKPDQQD